MQYDKALREEIVKYLSSYPIYDHTKDKYAKAAKKFNVDKEYIRGIWRKIKTTSMSRDWGLLISPKEEKSLFNKTAQSERKQDKDGLSVTINTNTEVKSLADLLVVCDVDGSLWEVVSWGCKKWDLGIKNKEEQIETKALFSVSAKFKPRSVETDLVLQKDLLMAELYKASPKREFVRYTKPTDKSCLLELCLFDPHFGKLAHAEESGKDEDLKIISAKYIAAITDLVSRVNEGTIDRIFLPVGNDMINVDGNNNMTTAGTPQSCDSRFYKVVRTVKELLINTINWLTTIAPVDVVVVPGNHDTQTMFMLGEMLDAYYHNSEVVNIDNSPRFRKYYRYGNTAIQLTHGNEEPHQTLGLIFATEQPKLWADVKFRYCQIGHFHKSKKLNYVSVDEMQGFQVQTIPSLSHNDAWHTKKGYNSLRQAKAFLIDRNQGIIGEFTHTSSL